jgi:hypothetical protein
MLVFFSALFLAARIKVWGPVRMAGLLRGGGCLGVSGRSAPACADSGYSDGDGQYAHCYHNQCSPFHAGLLLHGWTIAALMYHSFSNKARMFLMPAQASDGKQRQRRFGKELSGHYAPWQFSAPGNNIE